MVEGSIQVTALDGSIDVIDGTPAICAGAHEVGSRIEEEDQSEKRIGDAIGSSPREAKFAGMRIPVQIEMDRDLQKETHEEGGYQG